MVRGLGLCKKGAIMDMEKCRESILTLNPGKSELRIQCKDPFDGLFI